MGRLVYVDSDLNQGEQPVKSCANVIVFGSSVWPASRQESAEPESGGDLSFGWFLG